MLTLVLKVALYTRLVVALEPWEQEDQIVLLQHKTPSRRFAKQEQALLLSRTMAPGLQQSFPSGAWHEWHIWTSGLAKMANEIDFNNSACPVCMRYGSDAKFLITANSAFVALADMIIASGSGQLDFTQAILQVGNAFLPFMEESNPLLAFATGLAVSVFGGTWANPMASMAVTILKEVRDMLRALYKQIMKQVSQLIDAKIIAALAEQQKDVAYVRLQTLQRNLMLHIGGIYANTSAMVNKFEAAKLKAWQVRFWERWDSELDMSIPDMFDAACIRNNSYPRCSSFQGKGMIFVQLHYAQLHLNAKVELGRLYPKGSIRSMLVQNSIIDAQHMYADLLTKSLQGYLDNVLDPTKAGNHTWQNHTARSFLPACRVGVLQDFWSPRSDFAAGFHAAVASVLLGDGLVASILGDYFVDARLRVDSMVYSGSGVHEPVTGLPASYAAKNKSLPGWWITGDPPCIASSPVAVSRDRSLLVTTANNMLAARSGYLSVIPAKPAYMYVLQTQSGQMGYFYLDLTTAMGFALSNSNPLDVFIWKTAFNFDDTELAITVSAASDRIVNGRPSHFVNSVQVFQMPRGSQCTSKAKPCTMRKMYWQTKGRVAASSVAYSNDGKWMAIAENSGYCALHNLFTGTSQVLLRSKMTPPCSGFHTTSSRSAKCMWRDVSFSPDSTGVLCPGQFPSYGLKLFNLSTGVAVLARFQLQQPSQSLVYTSLAWSHLGKTLAGTGANPDELVLWNMTLDSWLWPNGSMLPLLDNANLSRNVTYVNVQFHPFRDILMANSVEGNISMWRKMLGVWQSP
eukprot:TRINITY_DN8762_c0_g1_i1.p1 TRINITY_DN8762_c0_g1~~TRINITY_DN8762_c0_g1_i1.p1  ORF type:complete len:806 (-),score=92.99 TRINITY_DN8762_c0_g1_i1:233-2626(-)